jgi:hypothetical protein
MQNKMSSSWVPGLAQERYVSVGKFSSINSIASLPYYRISRIAQTSQEMDLSGALFGDINAL